MDIDQTFHRLRRCAYGSFGRATRPSKFMQNETVIFECGVKSFMTDAVYRKFYTNQE